jgi:hypothetical protein
MKKLRSFEIEALVSLVWKKLNDEKKKNFIWIKKFDDINLVMKERGKEINRLIDEYNELKNKFYNENKEVSGNRIIFNMSNIGRYNEEMKFVKLNEGEWINWNVRNEIKNEVILSNIDGNVNDLVDRLFEKYKDK